MERSRSCASIIRSLSVGFLAFIGAVILAISWTMTTAIQLQATTALIMGGTCESRSECRPTSPIASQRYINPFRETCPTTPAAGCAHPGAILPGVRSAHVRRLGRRGRGGPAGRCRRKHAERRRPGDHFRLLAERAHSDDRQARVHRGLRPGRSGGHAIAGFVLLANPNKPNGGILERYKFIRKIPFLGITFDGATPTERPARIRTAATSRRPRTSPSSTTVSPTASRLGCCNLLALPQRSRRSICTCMAKAQRRMTNLIYQGSAGDTDYYIIDNDIAPDPATARAV